MKFSKSRNVGVFGNNVRDTGIAPSVWRYYLLSNRPETADTEFSWREFITRNNSELLANLGNFVNRVVKFINAKYHRILPDFDATDSGTFVTLKKDIDPLLQQFHAAMELAKIRDGLRLVMAVSARGNLFLQDHRLDNKLFNKEPQQAANVLGAATNLIYLLAALAYPFMPSTSASMNAQLNAPACRIPDSFECNLLPHHHIGKAAYLFSRIDESKEEYWRLQFAGGKGGKSI